MTSPEHVMTTPVHTANPLADHIVSLLGIMQREIENCMELLSALHREHAAVTNNTPALLEQTTDEKLHWLQQAEVLATMRTDIVSTAGLADDPQDMSACLSVHMDLVARWQQVQRIMVECQRQNQINGSVIELSRRHTLRALSLLRGQSIDQATYSASGETSGPLAPKMLATA